MRREPRTAYTLPRAVEAALVLHCAETGEAAADYVADAVAAALDLDRGEVSLPELIETLRPFGLQDLSGEEVAVS